MSLRLFVSATCARLAVLGLEYSERPRHRDSVRVLRDRGDDGAPMNGGRRAPWAGEFMGCRGIRRGAAKEPEHSGIVSKMSEDLCLNVLQALDPCYKPQEVRGDKTCLFASGRSP